MLRKLWQDDAGAVLSAELVLILTIAVLALIVGLSEVAVAVNTELNDLSNAFGRLEQSFQYTGFNGTDGKGTGKAKSQVVGATFLDAQDTCDINSACDLVCGADSNATSESTTLIP